MADEEGLSWHFVHEEILSSISTVDAFFKAVKIWIERPQVLNRRLVGSCILQSFLTRKSSDLFVRVFAMTRNSGAILRDDLLRLAEMQKGEIEEDSGNNVDIKIRSLVPRESDKYCNVLELIIEDKTNRSLAFIPFEEDKPANRLRCNTEHAYQVCFVEKQTKNNGQSISLSVVDTSTKGNGVTCPTVEWLSSFLLPKLHKWMLDDGESKFSLGQSLRLVSVEKYSKKYEELKQKYKHFVEIWPERTDPHKFVYEDVAIATYLLLLWEKESDDKNPKKFVDLGCGNGLLVHILTNEGHLGRGLDLRSRNVWTFYDDETVLEVSTLDPSTQTYPEADWLIGNHSDELTPWIPVIAARSSYKCKYLVLPCCFHDFYCKFQRVSSNERQYRSYLDYIVNIGKTCGFDVKEDVLRIPSTKKVCQIGQNRTYSPEEQESIEQEISRMLENARYGKVNEARELNDGKKSHCEMNATSGDESSCHHDDTQSDQSRAPRQFVPRCETEPVKNCTKVDKQLLHDIVTTVAMELLARSEEEGECNKDDGCGMKKAWSKGGRMNLAEVSQLFDQNVLDQLKCEAGGLKTVLRNFHQIFKVQGGTVEIRDWREDSHCRKRDMKQSTSKKYWKTKLCWFHGNHPDGCPLLKEQCSFAHGENDLRASQ